MKNKFLFTWILMLFALNSYNSQCITGSDVIIILDNSGSIDNIDYSQMAASTTALIRNILNCNTNNRVSVVHYGTNLNCPNPNSSPPCPQLPNSIPRIWIESDFTNNLATALSFNRRLNNGDHLHEAVGYIGDALDNVPNPAIISPQTFLNRNTTNNLVVFTFTDALRTDGSGSLSGGSYLVNFYNTTGSQAFQNFTNFKNDRGARFVMTHVSPDVYPTTIATAAAAGIASAGGTHNSPIENYLSDPDGQGVGPRMYLLKNNFVLTSDELKFMSGLICNLSNPLVFNFAYEPLCAFQSTQHNVFGNLQLPPCATFNNLSLVLRDINTLIEYPVSSTPTITPGQFEFNFNYFDISVPPMSGQFQIVVRLNYSLGGTNISIDALSDYFSAFNYLFELDYNCCKEDLVITHTVSTGLADYQIAANSITASNIIQNNATATYSAGVHVDLIPGFDSQSGSDFLAYIKGCTYIPDPLKQNPIPFEYRISKGNGSDYIPSKKNFEENDLIFYPNPTKGAFSIKSADKISSIRVYDAAGKLVLENRNSNKGDISEYPTGVYYMNIAFADGTIKTEKLIKE